MPNIDSVSVDLMVVLGTTSMPVHQVLRLSRGAIIELRMDPEMITTRTTLSALRRQAETAQAS